MSNNHLVRQYGQFVIDGRSAHLHAKQYRALGMPISDNYQSSGRAYIHSVKKTLDTIKMYQVGKAVLHQTLGRIVIRPFILTRKEMREARVESASYILGHYLDLNADAGYDSIRFTPYQWSNKSKNMLGLSDLNIDTEDEEPDSVLLHEILHTIRSRLGIRDRYRIKPIRNKYTQYENDEEYFAILLENIYRSEKGLPKIILGHDLHLREMSVEQFLKDPDYRKSMSIFKRQMPNLYRRVSKVNCAFNPILEYEKRLRKNSE